jgi:UDP-N-acetylglucosamine:LPS N-acetylglucosamine transferase
VKWPSQPLRVLIVSATVGAGDAGNARELARRLRASGHEVTVQDFLEAAPLRIGKAISQGYEAELRHAPWAYELAFQIWFWVPLLLVPLARFLSFFTRRKVLRWVREAKADVVVSTFPIATQVLGDLRRRSQRRRPWHRRAGLRVPAVNFITDFGYHPFWAHPGVDLNLAVHPWTVAEVAQHTGRPSAPCAPLVGPDFATARPRRAPQRTKLGLRQRDLAVLISSGSWGVGAVQETFELVATRPGLVPVVACGRSEALRQHLEGVAKAKGYRAVVLGWTDDMAGLMAACDALVENAGGLTSLEAMAAGLPLVSFHPIPGHGRNSAAAMSAAGVTCLARDGGELVDNLVLLGRPGPAREAQLAAAARLFSGDAAVAVADLAVSGAWPRPRLRPVVRVARTGAATVFAGALAWFGLTTGVGVAAAAGAGVAHPAPGVADAVYLGVRLGPAELVNPVVRQDLATLDASAVVDVNSAKTAPGAVRALLLKGIDVESGGVASGPAAPGEPRAPWSQALSDSRSVQVLSDLVHQPVGALCPNRSISAFDLVDASSAHLKVVVPNVTLPVAPSGPFPRQELGVPLMQSGHIYVVNGLGVTPAQLGTLLGNVRAQLSSQHLASVSYSWLE